MLHLRQKILLGQRGDRGGRGDYRGAELLGGCWRAAFIRHLPSSGSLSTKDRSDIHPRKRRDEREFCGKVR